MIASATDQDGSRRQNGLHELRHMAQYSRTNLIVNYLPQRLTDDEFRSLFSCVAPVKRAKVCRDKRSGYSFGFGFCEFYRPEDASRAIHTLNGHRLHHKTLKVAYARLQSAESKNCCLHLTNLPAWVAAEDIRRVLAPFGGIISCKILADPQGRSRGIGFCLFETHTAASQAMEAMNQKPWPDTVEPPIHIRFAHPNEKKVRAPALQHQQHQQQQNQQHSGYSQQQQQQQLIQQPQQQQQAMCCPEQLQQQQQMLIQPQQMWGCCQQQPMLQYPCPHPLMRATLAYPLPTGPLLLPPPQPPPPPPPAYMEFRVCATNLSPMLDDLQLYGLFAPFGGILEFSVARPEAQPAAAAPSAPEQAVPEPPTEASASGYSSGEDCAGTGLENDSGGGGGGGGSAEDGAAADPFKSEELQQSPEQQPMVAEASEAAAMDAGASVSSMHLMSMSLTVYVTFNNYQSAAGAVFSLNGQFIHGQQVQVAMRMLEPHQQAPMSESGDLGVAYQ